MKNQKTAATRKKASPAARGSVRAELRTSLTKAVTRGVSATNAKDYILAAGCFQEARRLALLLHIQPSGPNVEAERLAP